MKKTLKAILILSLVNLGAIQAKAQTISPSAEFKQSFLELLQDKPRFYSELENATGKKIVTEKIVGGSQASRNQFKEFTLVIAVDINGNPVGACGGTLIAPNKVLTAAHCLASIYYVVVPNFYSYNDDSSTWDSIFVSQAHAHPSYSSITSKNDIAVLTLEKNARTANIAVIYSGASSLAGNNSTIIGLGRTSATANTVDTLRMATVPVVSNAVCSNSEIGDVTSLASSQLCAGRASGGVGTCPGDSGGPLFVTVNKRCVQAGITSFGIPCAQPNAYDVYTRVSSYTSFIRQHSPNTNFVSDPTTNPPPSNKINIAPLITPLLFDDEA